MSLRSIFFEDLGTKALALILGLAIYVHVFSGQEREVTFRVPLTIAQLPSGLAFGSEPPAEVRVRVRATGAELVRLSARRFHAEVKIEEPKEGMLQRPLLGSDMKIPHGVRPALIEILEPRTLHLTIERKTSGQVPIALRLRNPVPSDRALSGAPTVHPPTVRLSGPRTLIAAVDSVETLPVEVEDWAQVRQVRASLHVPAGLAAEAETVTVHFLTEPRRTRRYPGVRIEPIPAYPERTSWIRPDSGTVEISGAASWIVRVQADRIRLLADTRGLDPGPHRVALRAVVPGLVGSVPVLVSVVPESVSVRVR